MNSKIRKYLTIFALGLSGGSIYFLPYIKFVFYDAQIASMGISNTQSGLLMTMYTAVSYTHLEAAYRCVGRLFFKEGLES